MPCCSLSKILHQYGTKRQNILPVLLLLPSCPSAGRIVAVQWILNNFLHNLSWILTVIFHPIIPHIFISYVSPGSPFSLPFNVYFWRSWFAVYAKAVVSLYMRILYRKDCGRWSVLSSVVPTGTLDATTVELRLSGLIGKGNHPDTQKTRIIGYFFENRLHCQLEVRQLLFTVCTCV
jgi:hypothetical protein